MLVYLLVLNMFLCAVAVASIIAFRITVFACDVIYPKSAILMADSTNSLGLIARCYLETIFFPADSLKCNHFRFSYHKSTSHRLQLEVIALFLVFTHRFIFFLPMRQKRFRNLLKQEPRTNRIQ